ncbi:MAG: LD-carboxypeptidase [Bacteroidota bacterium]
MIAPPFLTAGDTIYLTAPAKAIEESTVYAAKETIESWGLSVEIAEHCLGRDHYFSGTDQERLTDFQKGLDTPEFAAILCARGGYGCVRLIEHLSWDLFRQHPKWVIGFSDVTLLHQKIQQEGFQSIHGIMPLGFTSGSESALSSLKNALFGKPFAVTGPEHPLNQLGECSGGLIGGNMTLVYSQLGTSLCCDFRDKILFLEDVGEHLYKIDRMLYALRMAGAFHKIKGLILGGFTDMEDTDVPFGKTLEELVVEQVSNLNIPVAFGFPAGHIDDNQALILGKSVRLTVTEQGSSLFI